MTSQLTRYNCLPREIALTLFDIQSSLLPDAPYVSLKAAVLQLSAPQPASLPGGSFRAPEQLSFLAVADGGEQNPPLPLHGQSLETLQTAWGSRVHAQNSCITVITESVCAIVIK